MGRREETAGTSWYDDTTAVNGVGTRKYGDSEYSTSSLHCSDASGPSYTLSRTSETSSASSSAEYAFGPDWEGETVSESRQAHSAETLYAKSQAAQSDSRIVTEESETEHTVSRGLRGTRVSTHSTASTELLASCTVQSGDRTVMHSEETSRLGVVSATTFAPGSSETVSTNDYFYSRDEYCGQDAPRHH